jgi:hypothetical protein
VRSQIVSATVHSAVARSLHSAAAARAAAGRQQRERGLEPIVDARVEQRRALEAGERPDPLRPRDPVLLRVRRLALLRERQEDRGVQAQVRLGPGERVPRRSAA